MSNKANFTNQNHNIPVDDSYLQEYFKYIENNDAENAWKLKDKYVPKTVFRFFSLMESPKCSKCNAETQCYCQNCGVTEQCSLQKNNDDKLKSLENNQLWLANLDTLNDPFEFKYLYLDKNRLSHNDEHQILFNLMRKSIRVSCFVGASPVDNMPMWAHYANNHRGFCVEYAVKNSNFLFPVHYSSERIPIATIPAQISSSLNKAIFDNQPSLDSKGQQYILLLFLSAMVKFNFWEYEKEYRILYPTSKLDKVGELLTLKSLGLKETHIYIGKSCNSKYRQELIRIAKNINCPISDIYLDEYSPEFTLNSRAII